MIRITRKREEKTPNISYSAKNLCLHRTFMMAAEVYPSKKDLAGKSHTVAKAKLEMIQI